MSSPILKVENLSTGYGKKQVLYNISFEINDGEIVLLAGSNGSGKSTLLKAIYGILPIWKNSETGIFGNVKYYDEDLPGLPTSSLIKKGLLYIPQKDYLFENLTVKENLEMAGLNIDKRILKQRIDYSLSVFTELIPRLNNISIKLSGGEKRLLTLAMALLHDPKIMMIDEPFAGLTPKNINFVSNILKNLNKTSKVVLLIIEHRIKEALHFSNKIIGLKTGVVHIIAQIDNLFKIENINSIFI
ncbi:MAG: ATP-binding cassette domain-containing protein [Ignavibacteriae bacterium]|nr:ATP-binding cassette domain-containing protein [Ignavibacteriota bacterium]